jgi:hypothetical protein
VVGGDVGQLVGRLSAATSGDRILVGVLVGGDVGGDWSEYWLVVMSGDWSVLLPVGGDARDWSVVCRDWWFNGGRWRRWKNGRSDTGCASQRLSRRQGY